MAYTKFDDGFAFEMRSRNYSIPARWLYVVLRTYPDNTIAGIYPTLLKDLANAASFSMPKTLKLLDELSQEPDPVIRYKEDGRRLFIFVIHHLEINNRHLAGEVGAQVIDNQVKAIQKTYAEHSEWPFWDEFFVIYPKCKPLAYPLQAPSGKSEAPSKPLLSPSGGATKPLASPSPTLTKTKTKTPTLTSKKNQSCVRGALRVGAPARANSEHNIRNPGIERVGETVERMRRQKRD